MDKNQLNFLQFRTELLELLGKYNYKISGTNLGDGSINVENNKGNIYILRDAYSDYEALDNDYNSLPTDYIVNMFQEEHMNSFYNYKIGIFTNNRDKASIIFEDLYNQNKENIERYRQGKDQIDLLLKDGTYYTWIKPINMSRGHRCCKAYIDKNLTLDILNTVVVPICAYCTRENITVI